MSNVDPFAGITAGHLDGIDLKDPDFDDDGGPGPAYAPANLDDIQVGSLSGEGGTGTDEELEDRAEEELARINEELDASMAAALAAEAAEAPEQPVSEESDEDYTSRRVVELGLVKPEEQAPASRRGRPRGSETVVTPLITYIILGEGVLEDNRPFWFVASEVEATSYDNALYRTWMDIGRPAEGLKAHVIRKDSWEPRILEIELVPRAAARKVVVRQ